MSFSNALALLTAKELSQSERSCLTNFTLKQLAYNFMWCVAADVAHGHQKSLLLEVLTSLAASSLQAQSQLYFALITPGKGAMRLADVQDVLNASSARQKATLCDAHAFPKCKLLQQLPLHHCIPHIVAQLKDALVSSQDNPVSQGLPSYC